MRTVKNSRWPWIFPPRSWNYVFSTGGCSCPWSELPRWSGLREFGRDKLEIKWSTSFLPPACSNLGSYPLMRRFPVLGSWLWLHPGWYLVVVAGGVSHTGKVPFPAAQLLLFFTAIFRAAASFLKLNHFSPISLGYAFSLKTSELGNTSFLSLCLYFRDFWCFPMPKLSTIKKTDTYQALGHTFMFL